MSRLSRVRAARDRVLPLLGRDPARAGLSPRCPQCGRDGTTAVVRLGPRGARWWCRRCGATVSTGQPNAARRVPPAPPAPADPVLELLRRVLPEAGARWTREANPRRQLTPKTLDLAAMKSFYKAWDGFVRRVAGDPDGPEAAAYAALDGPPAVALAGLPALSAVLAGLHAGCYQPAAVHAPGADPGLLADRVGHVLAWLAMRPADCWLLRAEELPAVADDDRLDELAARWRKDDVDLGPGKLAWKALFGVAEGGPTAEALREVFGPDAVADALEAHRAAGARPLRELALARLTP